MDEKLVVGLLTFCGTLIAAMVWIIKYQFKKQDRTDEKLMKVAEASIKAIENNNAILHDLKEILENK